MATKTRGYEISAFQETKDGAPSSESNTIAATTPPWNHVVAPKTPLNHTQNLKVRTILQFRPLRPTPSSN